MNDLKENKPAFRAEPHVDWLDTQTADFSIQTSDVDKARFRDRYVSVLRSGFWPSTHVPGHMLWAYVRSPGRLPLEPIARKIKRLKSKNRTGRETLHVSMQPWAVSGITHRLGLLTFKTQPSALITFPWSLKRLTREQQDAGINVRGGSGRASGCFIYLPETVWAYFRAHRACLNEMKWKCWLSSTYA